MARQEELFPKPDEAISVHPSRAEAPLWIRRLVLWSEPGDVIREITFRRGLNVIWSPDPGSGAASLGQNAESGHGAGKTLLCRLLRYCLGEATFASDDQRRSILAKFPNGLVGAELFISGSCWAVIRPLGQTRRHLVRRETALEALLDSKDPATGVAPLVEALNTVVQPSSLSGIIPELRDDSSWLFALAWLVRDQENRFDHILDWRHARSESGSPVSSLSKDQVLAGVRAMLGILDDEEIRLKNDRQRLPPRRQGLDRDLIYFRRRIDELRTELLHRAGLDQDGALGGTLDLAALQVIAERRLRSAEQLVSSRPFASEIAAARRELDAVLQRSAVADRRHKDAEGNQELAARRLQSYMGERTDLKVQELRESHGDLCPVCFVPIDLALEQGCTLSTKRRLPESLADEKAELAVRIEECRSAISHYQAEANNRKAELSLLRIEEDKLRGEIADRESLAEQQREANERQRSDARDFERRLSEFGELQDRLSKAELDLLAIEDREKKLGEQQAVLRDRHSGVMRRFNEIYTYVCRGLLGSDVEASIDLTGQGLQARVQVGGQAMESLKALAFDVAAMLMGLEARAGLPAFLVHDSPREADLGESIYHRLFRFAVALENLSEQPPFQYIITTTSGPPAEIQSSEYVVQSLSGSTVNDRLLRCDLR
ncbi:MAG: hypothetical protein IT165_01680 [Bryobacterales bacterium]|nr:hypothetical protein [Bryobacterales bacterium]